MVQSIYTKRFVLSHLFLLISYSFCTTRFYMGVGAADGAGCTNMIQLQIYGNATDILPVTEATG